eukprot:m.312732 g.312732  ORF g.312732 m.312732 type:complete len:56 (+) comp301051_c0_seq1:247-414(+)
MRKGEKKGEEEEENDENKLYDIPQVFSASRRSSARKIAKQQEQTVFTTFRALLPS